MLLTLIRPLTLDDAPVCDAVLAALPTFFGDPDGIRDCAVAVRTQQGLVATLDETVVGFITLLGHMPGSVEITWLAVHAEHRRHGIGTQLVDAAANMLRSEGAAILHVLTLGPSVEEPASDDNYEGTRRFYTTRGFVPLRELALRDWNDASALILARAL